MIPENRLALIVDTKPALQDKPDVKVNGNGHFKNELELFRYIKQWEHGKTSSEEVRRTLGELGRFTRMYAAGMVDEYNADFIPTYGAPNTEILPGIYAVRARMRTLMKDTPQGRSIKRAYMSNVVGPEPFKLDMRYGTWEAFDESQAKTGQVKSKKRFTIDDDTNTAIEEFWTWFGRAQNLHTRKLYGWLEANMIVEGETVEAGGVVIRMYPGYPHNEIKFAVDFLETDRLQEQFMGFSGSDGRFGSGNPIRGSVEYDKTYGFPLAYWLLTRHPGEFFAQTPTWDEMRGKNFRVQVPASQIIYVSNLRDRAEQDTGMCEAASTVQQIWRSNQFDKALTLCAIASHIRAFVLVKTAPTGIEFPAELKEFVSNFMANYPSAPQAQGGTGFDPNNPVMEQQGVGSRAQTQRPAMWQEYPPGVEPKVIGYEFPTAESGHFREDNARQVAYGAGISYTDLTGNFQNMGFIAGLMSQVPSHRWYTIRQNHRKETFLYPLFYNALKAAIQTGWFDKRGYGFISIDKLDDYVKAAKFKGHRWPFVNPMIEMQTLILAMEAGFKSPQQVQDELPDGINVEDLYRLYAEAKQEAANNGLDFSSSDPTRPNIQKGVPGESEETPEAQADAAQPPPKSKTANPLRSGRSGRGRVILVRHGCTDKNGECNKAGSGLSDDRVRGHQDVPINDQGREEARAAGDLLQEVGIRRIFSSDLSRAFETGEIIAAKTGSAYPQTTFDLRPWGFGADLQGKLSSEVQPILAKLAKNPHEKRSGGESFNEFTKRFFRKFDQIVSDNKNRNIVVICHYRTLRLLQSRATSGVDITAFLKFNEHDQPGSVHELKAGKVVDLSPLGY